MDMFELTENILLSIFKLYNLNRLTYRHGHRHDPVTAVYK